MCVAQRRTLGGTSHRHTMTHTHRRTRGAVKDVSDAPAPPRVCLLCLWFVCIRHLPLLIASLKPDKYRAPRNGKRKPRVNRKLRLVDACFAFFLYFCFVVLMLRQSSLLSILPPRPRPGCPPLSHHLAPTSATAPPHAPKTHSAALELSFLCLSHTTCLLRPTPPHFTCVYSSTLKYRMDFSLLVGACERACVCVCVCECVCALMSDAWGLGRLVDGMRAVVVVVVVFFCFDPSSSRWREGPLLHLNPPLLRSPSSPVLCARVRRRMRGRM